MDLSGSLWPIFGKVCINFKKLYIFRDKFLLCDLRSTLCSFSTFIHHNFTPTDWCICRSTQQKQSCELLDSLNIQILSEPNHTSLHLSWFSFKSSLYLICRSDNSACSFSYSDSDGPPNFCWTNLRDQKPNDRLA